MHEYHTKLRRYVIVILCIAPAAYVRKSKVCTKIYLH